MAGPGDLAGDGWLRVSHADRDQVVATLQDAFVAGMLTRDELDTRVSRALAARTRGDLGVLTRDLPPVPAGVGRPAGLAPRRCSRSGRRRRPLVRASVQAACCLVFAFCMVAIAGHFDPGGPGPNPQHGHGQAVPGPGLRVPGRGLRPAGDAGWPAPWSSGATGGGRRRVSRRGPPGPGSLPGPGGLTRLRGGRPAGPVAPVSPPRPAARARAAAARSPRRPGAPGPGTGP